MFSINKILNIFVNRSYAWKKLRDEHLKRENFCQACQTQKKLQVHHIVPVNIDHKLELDPNNLITLCYKCHLLFGHLMDYRSWNPLVKQDCENMRDKINNRPYLNKLDQ